jgi:vacuolar-type H+-ATPase subunit I/STV1
MTHDPDAWAAIRARYEAATETVAQIAADIATTPHKLTLRARAEGWLLRTAQKVKKSKPQNTRDTIKRLKELLQNRLTQLEGQLSAIGEEVNALASERDIRATNTLVRTLEKVLELEHKERKQRSSRARQSRKLNDAERAELTRRIENLRLENQQTGASDDIETGLAGVTGLDTLGKAGSTAARG